MTITTTKIFAGMTLVAMLVASGTAFAGGSLSPAPIKIRYSDLNLSTPEGARALYTRIRAAADEICGPNFADWYPGNRNKYRECYRKTVDAAVKHVDQPMLTSLHEQQRTMVASR
jgi:UrcA family protein